ncbi:putative beta-lysine N-acetyltransferase [Petrocella sp. FN5]|uniref:putative beta-lysine N-acetyltransferase n=1 Tax=Petrocella sp. FN5 TaxID=3032002 RepID=UPI0023DAB74C|nr:putative beta-lysine N-acetyltransferase [Petrocella sp. FN5]MDF1617192.1 putative beta-lysine N-acetyltransferase [Petrocella sp. FN5]
MKDTIEKKEGITIHHGTYSDRIYVMSYDPEQAKMMLDYVRKLGKEKDYGKIIIKAREIDRELLQGAGFSKEGEIEGYYSGTNHCLFMAKYLKADRRGVRKKAKILDTIDKAKEKKVELDRFKWPSYTFRRLGEEDIGQMIKVYEEVFETYPFPIYDPDYIRKTMMEHCQYFGVFDQEGLIGLSTCEINHKEKNVEMTDFAVLPSYRGHKLAKALLITMEKAMAQEGISTYYTIARSQSLPMNMTFSSLGYHYGGTLWNNTQIAGNIESMNIWVKQIDQ